MSNSESLIMYSSLTAAEKLSSKEFHVYQGWRIANALHNSPKPLINQPETHDTESVLARCWARRLHEDKRLQNLLANWENLPEPIKAAIMAMVASVQSQ